MSQDETQVATTTYAPIVGPAAYSEAWYAGRRSYFGASECARALNLSDEDHGQALDVYLEKVGLAEPFEGNEFSERGKRFEPFIALEYERFTGQQVAGGFPVHFHPSYPFIGATIDARRASDPLYLAEFKACNWRRAQKLGEQYTDEIFTDWLMQAQQQMFVMGAHTCDVFVMIDLHTYKLFTVAADADLQLKMVAVLSELWDRIERRDPPPPDFNNAGTLELLKKMHGVQPGLTVALNFEIAQAWSAIVQDKQLIKDAEERVDQNKSRVLFAMGEAQFGRLPLGQKELVRSVIADSIVKLSDVDVLRQKVGKVGRKGYPKLTERAVAKQ